MDYYNKYLKYKTKYLELKYYNQYGSGVVPCDKGYKNLLGTCWAVATQMIFSFGHLTSEKLNERMELFNTGTSEERLKLRDAFIETQINTVQENEELKDFFPSYIFILPKRNNLEAMLKKFVDRYNSKVFDSHLTTRPDTIKSWENLRENKKDPTYEPYFEQYTQNPGRCETVISDNYKQLFDYKMIKENSTSHGSMTILDNYLFCNLLSIFFLEEKVSFTNYYDNFRSIQFDRDTDLGMLIIIKRHVCCLFICDGVQKFYDDNDLKISNCDWIDLLNNAPSTTNNLYIGKGCLHFRNKSDFNVDDLEKPLKKVEFLIKISKYKDTDTPLDIDIKTALSFDNLETITDPGLRTDISRTYGIDGKYIPAFEFLKPTLSEGKFYPAITRLADMYKDGVGVRTDHKKGHGVAINHTEAFRLYSLAERMGDPLAYAKLGDMYKKGLGTGKDPNKAFEEYRYADYFEDASVYVKLGKMYEKGKGTTQDFDKAIIQYKKAINSEDNPGNANAYYQLGNMHYFGKGVQKNYEEAFRLYNRAIEDEDLEKYKSLEEYKDLHYMLYTTLGHMYEKGKGTEENLKKALECFIKAGNHDLIKKIQEKITP